MGLLSFLKSDKPTYSDKVWKSADHAIKGMMTEALQAVTRNEAALVLYFFEDRGTEINDFIDSNHVPHFALNESNTGEALQQPQTVFTLNADLLTNSRILTFFIDQARKQKLQLLFYGHYPLPSKEDKILEKLSSINSAALVFFSSLDDPALRIFGVTRIKATLDTLGVADDEVIQHAMVTKSLRRAREKVEQSINREILCSSEKEWFQKNIKIQKD